MGDMLELGKHSKKLHRDVSNVLNKSKINKIHIYGKDVLKHLKVLKIIGKEEFYKIHLIFLI